MHAADHGFPQHGLLVLHDDAHCTWAGGAHASGVLLDLLMNLYLIGCCRHYSATSWPLSHPHSLMSPDLLSWVASELSGSWCSPNPYMPGDNAHMEDALNDVTRSSLIAWDGVIRLRMDV